MTNDQILSLADRVFADRNNMSTFTFFATNVELIEFAKMVASEQRVKDADICLSLFDLEDDSCDEAEQCAAAIMLQE
jgi:hypothetical protein